MVAKNTFERKIIQPTGQIFIIWASAMVLHVKSRCSAIFLVGKVGKCTIVWLFKKKRATNLGAL